MPHHPPRRHFRFPLLAAAAVVLAGFGAVGTAKAEPALWVVRDADSTMHLFGTIHILKPETVWRTPTIETAFKDAAEVWFEIDIAKSQDPAVMGGLAPLMIDGTPLAQRLSAELYARYLAKLNELGVPAANFEPLKTSMVALTITVLAMQKAGYNPDAGVDPTLSKEVGSRGLRTLETVEQQIRFITDMPEEVQSVMLEQTLDQLEDPGYIDRMVNAWAAGDTSVLESILLKDLKAESREAYDIFVKDRNEAWVELLAKEMDGAGTDFVAVGALHLVGPDGVPELLKARGYTVEQITGKK